MRREEKEIIIDDLAQRLNTKAFLPARYFCT
jgi:hypothetical protein